MHLLRATTVCLFVTFSFGLSLTMTRPATGQESQAKTRLIEDWKAVDELDKRQQSYLVTLSRPDIPSMKPRQSRIKIRAGSWLSTTDYLGERVVFVKSPQYDFLLNSQPGANGYTLRAMERYGDAVRTEFATVSLSSRDCRPLGAFHNAGKNGEARDPTLFEISQRPDFKLVTIRTIRPGFDRVDFSFAETTGWAVADRANSSIVVESELKSGKMTSTTYPITLTMKRQLQGGGLSVRCERIEYTVRNSTTNKGLSHELLEFTDYENGPIGSEEFTFGYYDMPEPVGMVQPKRTRSYVWLLTAAAVFGALSIGIRYLARRRGSTPSGSM